MGYTEIVREVAKADGDLALDGYARVVRRVEGDDEAAYLRRSEVGLRKIGCPASGHAECHADVGDCYITSHDLAP